MATKSDVPKVQNLIFPTFLAIQNLGGSGTLQEINDEVATILELPDEIQQVSKGDTADTWFAYRCRWARSYLKIAGYAENSERGVWSLTVSGKSATKAQIDDVWSEVHRITAERRTITNQEIKDENSVELPSEKEKSIETWKDRLLAKLKTVTPDGFERLSQRILRESGFTQVRVTGRSGDGGIDGTGVLRVNLISFQTLFQCKRYKDTVGPNVIRDFRGAMIGRADKGLIITTGRFTAEAQREATRDGAPAIELIDGEELCELLRQLKLGIRIEYIERIEISDTFFDNI